MIDMNNNKEIKLNLQSDTRYCTFNLKGELILYGVIHDRVCIWIYSTQTKNNKWICKRIYELRKDSKLVCISKDDKIYFSSNDSIYEWNILTEKSIRISYNKEDNKVIKYILNYLFESIL